MTKIKTYQLGEVIEFGKYAGKGITVEMAIDADPKYIQWCADNVHGFVLSEGSKLALQERFR